MRLSILLILKLNCLAIIMVFDAIISSCRYNDIGYVANTFVDYVNLVRVLGQSDKQELLHTLDFTIPKFVRSEMERRHKLSTRWYGVPLTVLSQMIDPVR